jgi:hypothetical protein
MAISIVYQPGKGISIDGKLLLWGADRQELRTFLNDSYEVADSIVDISQYNDGDSSKNIIQRRDIYENYKN